jgi:hypothetical protein
LFTIHSASADICAFTDKQLKLAQKVFEEYGPTPRLCIQFVELPTNLEQFEVKRASLIRTLSWDDLFKITKQDDLLNMDLSHHIFLVRRKDEANLLHHTIEPITPFVNRLLGIRLKKVQRVETLREYLLKARMEDSRLAAGYAFESIVQIQFREEVVLTLVPMVKVPPPPRGTKFQFYSEPIDGLVTAAPIPIRFTPERSVEYVGSNLDEIRSNVFYVPSASNQAGFDSFILVDGILYIWQITIAHSHEISGRIMSFFSQNSIRSVVDNIEWRFVFVIPRGGHLIFPGPKKSGELDKFFEKAKLYTAQFDAVG